MEEPKTRCKLNRREYEGCSSAGPPPLVSGLKGLTPTPASAPEVLVDSWGLVTKPVAPLKPIAGVILPCCQFTTRPKSGNTTKSVGPVSYTITASVAPIGERTWRAYTCVRALHITPPELADILRIPTSTISSPTGCCVTLILLTVTSGEPSIPLGGSTQYGPGSQFGILVESLAPSTELALALDSGSLSEVRICALGESSTAFEVNRLNGT